MAGKRKKRRWPDEEKRSICFQTTAANVSVAQVARRYAMNANLKFKWSKNERYAPDAVPEESEPVFLPVDVEIATSPVLALATAPAGRIGEMSRICWGTSLANWEFPLPAFGLGWGLVFVVTVFVFAM
jgi:transposase